MGQGRRWRWMIAWTGVSLACLAGSAQADSWELPTPHTYMSLDKNWRLTVTPRPLDSQLAYYKDRLANRDNPGAPRGNVRKKLGSECTFEVDSELARV